MHTSSQTDDSKRQRKLPKSSRGLSWCMVAVMLLLHVAVGKAEEKHLFILSGQSNMAGLDPEISFVPAVESALGADRVLVIKDAQGGQPIRRWYKDWKTAEGTKPGQIGDLYDRLMTKVNAEVKGVELKTITFVWMQGERDAREKHGDVYAASLLGVVEQLKKDLDAEHIGMVVGRLSDFDMNNKRYPHWTKIREEQVKLADANPWIRWVDTDDLNDGKNKQGKEITDDLHYSVDGYKELGARFAKEALELVESTATDK